MSFRIFLIRLTNFLPLDFVSMYGAHLLPSTKCTLYLIMICHSIYM